MRKGFWVRQGGKDGLLLEGIVWRKVVLTSKKPIFEGFGRFLAAI